MSNTAIKVIAITTAVVLAVVCAGVASVTLMNGGFNVDAIVPPPDPNRPDGPDPKDSIKAQPVDAPVGNWSNPIASGPVGQVPQVSIQYFGIGSNVDRNRAEKVLVNSTYDCKPSTDVQGDQWVITDCNNDVYLPPGHTWLAQIIYDSYEYCNGNIKYVIYEKAGRCHGAFTFGRWDCNGNYVQPYICKSPYCNDCQASPAGPIKTNSCQAGYKYQCVIGSNGTPVANPMM